MSNNTAPPPAVESQRVRLTPGSLAEAVKEGLTVKEIAKKFGVSYSVIYKRALKAGLRVAVGEKRYTVDPTVEEIEERARAIRATWSPEETERRMSSNAPRRVEYDRRGMAF